MNPETHRGDGGGVIGIETPGAFCSATTRAGKWCRSMPLQAEGLCFAHSLKLAERHKATQALIGSPEWAGRRDQEPAQERWQW